MRSLCGDAHTFSAPKLRGREFSNVGEGACGAGMGARVARAFGARVMVNGAWGGRVLEFRKRQSVISSISDKTERRFIGLPVSSGVALARVFLVSQDHGHSSPHYTVSEREVSGEQARVEQAVRQASLGLDTLIGEVASRIGETHAEIFVAQKMMTEDPELLERMFRVISEDRVNAETALEKTLGEYDKLLREVDDEYMRERSSDIAEVRRRLLDCMERGGRQDVVLVDNTFRQGEKRIIVAEELTPGLTVSLDVGNTVGFITARGGRASHSAILARALGIPAVTGLDGILEVLGHGEQVLMNGETGEVIVWPAERTVELCPAINRIPATSSHLPRALESIRVMANINVASDAALADAVNADGIGLYRTEYEFLAAGRILSEEEQFDRYAHVVEVMGERPVYFRLLDFGGDKAAPFLALPEEDNPALGFRGARLLQARPELLVPQVRALARVSVARPVHVMYPMITEFEQFIRLKTLIEQQTDDIHGAQWIHGVMFEVPSACLDAERLYTVAGFGSIGSNDLTQYLFAVDRNNQHVAYDFQHDRPVFWRLVTEVGKAARMAGKLLGLCGEMGSQAEALPRLIDAGIGSTSVSPRLVPLVRMAARRAGLK